MSREERRIAALELRVRELEEQLAAVVAQLPGDTRWLQYPPPVIFCKTQPGSGITAGGSARCIRYDPSDAHYHTPTQIGETIVWNYFSNSIAADTKILAAWAGRRWVAIAEDCPP